MISKEEVIEIMDKFEVAMSKVQDDMEAKRTEVITAIHSMKGQEDYTMLVAMYMQAYEASCNKHFQ